VFENIKKVGDFDFLRGDFSLANGLDPGEFSRPWRWFQSSID
jgi:hypothetical protein